MLSIILIAGVLVAVTVAVHAAGITVLLHALSSWHPILPTRFWLITRLLGRHRLVAGSPSSDGSFGLGVVLSVVGMPARC